MRIIIIPGTRKSVPYTVSFTQYQEWKGLRKEDIEQLLLAVTQELEAINAKSPQKPGNGPSEKDFLGALESKHGKGYLPNEAERAGFQAEVDAYENACKAYKDDQEKKAEDPIYQKMLARRDQLNKQLLVLKHQGVSPSSIILETSEISDDEVRANCKKLGISVEDVDHLLDDFKQLKLVADEIHHAIAEDKKDVPQDELTCVTQCRNIIEENRLTAGEKLRQINAALQAVKKPSPSNWFMRLIERIAQIFGLTKESRSIIQEIRKKSNKPSPKDEPPDSPHP